MGSVSLLPAQADSAQSLYASPLSETPPLFVSHPPSTVAPAAHLNGQGGGHAAILESAPIAQPDGQQGWGVTAGTERAWPTVGVSLSPEEGISLGLSPDGGMDLHGAASAPPLMLSHSALSFYAGQGDGQEGERRQGQGLGQGDGQGQQGKWQQNLQPPVASFRQLEHFRQWAAPEGARGSISRPRNDTLWQGQATAHRIAPRRPRKSWQGDELPEGYANGAGGELGWPAMPHSADFPLESSATDPQAGGSLQGVWG